MKPIPWKLPDGASVDARRVIAIRDDGAASVISLDSGAYPVRVEGVGAARLSEQWAEKLADDGLAIDAFRSGFLSGYVLGNMECGRDVDPNAALADATYCEREAEALEAYLEGRSR